MMGEKFLAILVVAMTIRRSVMFTLPATGSTKKKHHTSSRSNTCSFEKEVLSSSALGMATWSNGELNKMCT